MRLSMARCIGQAGCDGAPGARGLCPRCYERHHYNGTLKNYPTMRERASELRARGQIPLVRNPAQARRVNSRATASRNQRMLRYAERVEVDGVWIHPSDRHGSLHSYNGLGCRGMMCREALRHYRRTGETYLPDARTRNFGPEDCLLYERASGRL